MIKKKPKFVPLDTPPKKYLYTRSEVLKNARNVLKSLWHKELTLEDTNKISFRTDDLTFRELMQLMLEFDTEVDTVSDMWLEDARDEHGFWINVMFEWSKLFPLGRKRMQKTGRLKGMMTR